MEKSPRRPTPRERMGVQRAKPFGGVSRGGAPWSSDQKSADKKIATVDAKGNVKGVKTGKTALTREATNSPSLKYAYRGNFMIMRPISSRNTPECEDNRTVRALISIATKINSCR